MRSLLTSIIATFERMFCLETAQIFIHIRFWYISRECVFFYTRHCYTGSRHAFYTGFTATGVSCYSIKTSTAVVSSSAFSKNLRHFRVLSNTSVVLSVFVYPAGPAELSPDDRHPTVLLPTFRTN